MRLVNRLRHTCKFSRMANAQARDFSEIKIPVPWGHVAGKWWGPGKTRPVVSVHGWQDNSGSFDRLIPLLPNNIEFLAIDLPGHGYSSPLPSGIFYHALDTVILLRRLQKYFNWSQMSLMSHSLGAITSFMFSTTFPQDVDLLICIDGFRPLEVQDIVKKRPVHIDNFLKYDMLRNYNDKKRPSFSMDVMEQMWHEGSRKSVDLDKCSYILKRNLAPSNDDPNTFYLTLDPRLKVGTILNFPQEEIVEATKLLKMPILTTKATRTISYSAPHLLEEVRQIMAEYNPKSEHHEVEGTHHVHLNNPERLQGIISEFLNKYYRADEVVANLVKCRV